MTTTTTPTPTNPPTATATATATADAHATPAAEDASSTGGEATASGSRCFGDGDPLYERYHDEEWGRQIPISEDEHELLERLSLEAFQSGLSWILVLRRREGFRAAFAGFDPAAVATYDETDVERLMQDPGIVRNRAKIRATIADARALLAMHERGERLWDVLERHRPGAREHPPTTWIDVPGKTVESIALAKELKSLGFAFVGPTTAYATLQAVGLVDDHLADCRSRFARVAVPYAREA